MRSRHVDIGERRQSFDALEKALASLKRLCLPELDLESLIQPTLGAGPKPWLVGLLCELEEARSLLRYHADAEFDGIDLSAEETDLEMVRADLEVRYREIGALLVTGPRKAPEDDAVAEDYVTLDMVAIVARTSKRTLERHKADTESNMPPPDVEGGGGKADKWAWSRIRPWLQATFAHQFPERFPQFPATRR
jgi:hypothetical protein